MDDPELEFRHGDQDAAAQVATYEAFGKLTKWGSLTVGVLILVLTLWFCTGAGFVGSVITGGIVAALGIWFLRSPLSEEL